MSSEARFTIVYSNIISVFDGDNNINTFPFGVIHTESFLSYKRKLSTIGSVREAGSFYPRKIIFKEVLEPTIQPRNYQQEVVSIACSNGIYNGIFEAPTGSGKTNMIAYIIAKRNCSSIVIVPTTGLVDQTVARVLSVLGISEEMNASNKIVGALGNGRKEFDRPILVTTWHSLMDDGSRARVLAYGYYMLICDEVHRSSANLLSKYIGMFKSRLKFGFSASVYRSRKEQIETVHSLMGPKIHSVDIEELYANGFVLKPNIHKLSIPFSANTEVGIRYHYEELLQNKKKMRFAMVKNLFENQAYKIFRPKDRNQFEMINNPSESDIKILANIAILMKAEAQKKIEAEERRTLTYDEITEAKKKRNSVSLGLAKKGIDNYKKRSSLINVHILQLLQPPGNTERAAILTSSIAAGEAIASLLRSSGYANVIVVNGSDDNKKKVVEELSAGNIDDFIIVSTVQFLSEGTDIPKLSKIFIPSPVYPPYTSIERLQQITGRAVRPDFTLPDKVANVFVFDDEYTDGITAEKKNAMWSYCLDAFKVDAIVHGSILDETLVFQNGDSSNSPKIFKI